MFKLLSYLFITLSLFSDCIYAADPMIIDAGHAAVPAPRKRKATAAALPPNPRPDKIPRIIAA